MHLSYIIVFTVWFLRVPPYCDFKEKGFDPYILGHDLPRNKSAIIVPFEMRRADSPFRTV